MDTTIDVALKIISNPNINAWRKTYWKKFIKDEISGLRIAKLYGQADILEKQLNAITSSQIQSETSSGIR